MGVAYYGSSGDEIAQLPDDAHDLAQCKKIVNNAIRMLFNDAPPTGWRFARPVMETVLWNTVNVSATVTCSAVEDSGRVLVTASEDIFYPTMELKLITVTDVGDVMITRYISETQVEVDLNDNSVWTDKTFSIAKDGNYALPKNYAGMVTGEITYIADSNQGVPVGWANEARIRQLRQNITDETGDPYWAAIRIIDQDGLGNPIRRRWELMVYPMPNADRTVEFPFELYFDRLEDEADLPPIPPSLDETLRAACLAVVERDVYDKPGHHSKYYDEKALPNGWTIDARSGPRRLGYFGNPTRGPVRDIRSWRRHGYDRPTVTYTP
jgi:hypothetical protein